MDYGQIVSQGWQITWKNKYLWVLGFLAALTSSRSNVSSSNSSSSSFDPTTFSEEQLVAMGGVFVAIMCFAVFVGLILWVVSLVAKGSLITAVYKISIGKEMSLGQALSAGAEKIWSILGMNLLLYLPFFLAWIVIAGAVFVMFAGAIGTAFTMETFAESGADPAAVQSLVAGMGTFFICFMMLCCVLMIVGVVVQFINAFAYRGIMIHNMGVMQSISHSWQLINQNFGEVLILSILFGLIGLGYGILMMMILMPILLIGMIPMMAVLGSSGDFSAIGIMYGLGFGTCMGIIGAIFVSIIVTWQSATFTLAYKEWTKKMGFSHADDIDNLDDIIEKSPA